VMPIAENEVRNCQDLDSAGAVICLGHQKHNSVDSIKKAILKAVENPKLCLRLSRRSLAIMSECEASHQSQLYEALA